MSPRSRDLINEWSESLPGADSFLAALSREQPLGDCRCAAFGPVKSPVTGLGHQDLVDFWPYLARVDSLLLGTGVLSHIGGRSNVLKFGFVQHVLVHFRAAAWDCAPGVATLIFQYLDAIYEGFDHKECQQLFLTAVALVRLARGFTCRLDFSVLREDFIGNAFVPNFGRLPFLLGLDDSRVLCPSSAPKVFVYDVGERWTPNFLRCATGISATEVWFHRQLQQSTCRAEAAEDANLLYVPLYTHCLHSQAGARHNRPNATDSLAAQIKELLMELQHFEKRAHDHVFLFPDEFWPVLPQDFAPGGLFGNAIVLSPEGNPLQCSRTSTQNGKLKCAHSRPNSARFIAVPSFVDSWRASLLQTLNLPLSRRHTLASFMGFGVATSRMEADNFRHLLGCLVGVPGFYVANHGEDYAEILGSSLFCLVPKGIGTWTHRLYEVLLAGCIPVILSDDIMLPFPTLSWEAFSVQWPMRKVDNTSFPAYLRELFADLQAMRRMKEAVDQHSCWFNYHSDLQECSAFFGIMQRLQTFDARSVHQHSEREYQPMYYGNAKLDPKPWLRRSGTLRGAEQSD